ncbi:MAG TPA: efflux RND transporter periplasmic adaptor subunit [Thiobacillus sp.]|jgi:cobalt-zinc-cadmium efflux system membrane fusion protein|nr:efflux RND transporter periplasmic adaptor subunit [Thiobacillus sp.]
MKLNLNKKQTLSIAAVLGIGVVLAGLILGTGKPQPAGDEQGQDSHAEAPGHADEEPHAAEAGPAKGPHGGKLFNDNGYGLEVTIFEQGVPPEFRVYLYRDGKPVDPSSSQVAITLHRLGREPQAIQFAKVGDYLRGDAEVVEPHSFKVEIAAQSGGKAYRFGYDQIEARVSLSDAQLKQNGVNLLTAGPARINAVLQLIGEIRLNEDRMVHVVPLLTGVVVASPANAGDRVKKGQLLAVISSQALADQRSELLAAQKRLALTRTTFEREKQLWAEKISAEQDYLEAKHAMQEAEIAVQNARQKLASLGGAGQPGSALTRYEIRAPIDGVVVEKHLSLGEAVQGDAKIFVIADLSTVWVDMTVAAKDLGAVKTGQKADIQATAFAAQGSGTISYVGALVGEATRAATARVVLPNPDGVWRPGLQVKVQLVTGSVEVPVAVAAEAIQSLRDRTVVFGRYGNELEARPLELGRSDGKFIEVVSGLNASEVYAATNSFLIKADLEKSGASHDH